MNHRKAGRRPQRLADGSDRSTSVEWSKPVSGRASKSTLYRHSSNLKPKRCIRQSLTLLEKAEMGPTAALLIKGSCQMSAFAPAVRVRAPPGLLAVVLPQHQQRRVGSFSEIGGGYGPPKIQNGRNQIALHSSASKRDGWSPHGEKHRGQGTGKFCKSTASHFSKHQD